MVLCVSLYRQIMQQPDLAVRWNQISQSWQKGNFWLVILLMPLNWGLESLKWQMLMHRLQPFSFVSALKSVLAGCSVTMLTPNRIGEYGGRVLFVEPVNRVQAISLTIVGSLSQLLVTLIAGAAGMVFLRYFSQEVGAQMKIVPDFLGNFLIVLSGVVALLTAMLYWKISWLMIWIGRWKWVKKIQPHIAAISAFNNATLWKLFSVSVLRYIVFVLQYVWMLQVMEVEVGFVTSFAMITVFYIIMALAPTIGFIELPLRLSVLGLIYQLVSNNELGVSSAALGVWFINLVIPAILGSLLILRVRVIKEKAAVKT